MASRREVVQQGLENQPFSFLDPPPHDLPNWTKSRTFMLRFKLTGQNR